MKRPVSLAVTPRDYVQQLNFRNRNSSQVHLCILNGFQRFLVLAEGGCVSEKAIREWLKDRIRVWPLHMVLQRARVVDRFLDWKVQKGALGENPLAKLRGEYGQSATTPVVRALLSRDSGAALEALRPPLRFGSFMGPVMREHLALMRAMGYRYDVHECRMLRLDRFLQNRPDLAGQSLPVVIGEWRKTKPTPQHALQCQCVGRTLSRALSRIDPHIKGIVWDRRINREACQRHRRPYIFNESEIGRLFKAALSFPSPRSSLRPHSLYTMLVLAYCAGLRIGEIVRLNLGDIDQETRTIEVRDTKFFKTRRLPLSNSAAAAIGSYLDARRESGAPIDLSAGLFWQEQDRARYAYGTAEKLLVRLFKHAGLKPENGKTGPRVHDLRHAFVVHRMLAWYRGGINPQLYLPYLATYLGHRDIKSTLVYLTITQELLQAAGERFRHIGAPVLHGVEGGGQ